MALEESHMTSFSLVISESLCCILHTDVFLSQACFYIYIPKNILCHLTDLLYSCFHKLFHKIKKKKHTNITREVCPYREILITALFPPLTHEHSWSGLFLYGSKNMKDNSSRKKEHNISYLGDWGVGWDRLFSVLIISILFFPLRNQTSYTFLHFSSFSSTCDSRWLHTCIMWVGVEL